MMQFIRDHANSLWAKILLIGVGVSLAGIGGTQIFSGPSADTVASVNGSKITLQEIEAQYQQLLNANSQNGDITEEIQHQLKLIARRDLVERRALENQVKDWEIRASDRAVAEEIVSIPAFQKDGVFDQETYKTALFYSGYNIETFENAVRGDVQNQLVRDALTGTAFVPQKTVIEEVALLGQTRDITVASYNYLDDLSKIDISPEAVNAHFEANKDQYVTPNRIKVQYLELTPAMLTATTDVVQPSADEIDAEMAQLKKENEQRSSEQFTIEYANDSEKDAALKLLSELRAELIAGNITFDEAKAKIADVDNAYYNRNGNFKYGAAGIPQFDDALFSLTEADQYSEPFATDGEVHLVHLLAVTSPYNSEEELKKAAIASLTSKEANDLYLEKEARMQQLAETYTDSLIEIAQDINVPLKETEWLSIDQPEGLIANPTVWNALNSTEVLDNQKNSLPFAFNDEENHAMIVRVLEKDNSRQKSVEESFDEIRAELAKDRAKTEITNQVNAMLEAGDFQNLQNEFEQMGFAYNQYNDLAISSIGTLPAKPAEQYAINSAFQKVQNVPADKPEVTVEDVDGNLVIVATKNIKKGDIKDLPEEVQAQIANYLQGREASYEYQALLLYILNNSDVKLYSNSFFE